MRTHAGCAEKDDIIVFASPQHFGYMTAQLRGVIDRMKRKTVLISTGRGTDYTMMLQQYGVYSLFGWDSHIRVLFLMNLRQFTQIV